MSAEQAQFFQDFFWYDKGLPIQGVLIVIVGYAVRQGVYAGIKYGIDALITHHPNLITKEQLTADIEETKKFMTDMIAFKDLKEGKVPVKDLPIVIDSKNPPNITNI